MKVHIVAFATLAIAATCMAIPRNKKQGYEEARLSNEVIPGDIEVVDETSQEVITATDKTSDYTPASIETTKPPALDDAPTQRPGHKKKKPNSGAVVPVSDTFSRVIDDIFNIPISVLRAVNTLISNAFGTKQVSVSIDKTSSA